MQSRPFFIVDVFAPQKYAGNQLAVITDARGLETDQMQKIARETNYSETTFVIAESDGYHVRIFTPAAEIPFAGHPLLGTAHVIRHEIAVDRPANVTLHLEVGPVPVTFNDDGQGKELAWFHRATPTFGPQHEAESIAELLGLDVAEIDSRLPIQEVTQGNPITIIPVRNLESLRRARLNAEQWQATNHPTCNTCLYLFCRQASDVANDLSARLFAPHLGVPEDPATGSAAAVLTGYLLRHAGDLEDGLELKLEQGAQIGRPSLLMMRGSNGPDGMRISVGGQVVMTVRGELV